MSPEPAHPERSTHTGAIPHSSDPEVTPGSEALACASMVPRSASDHAVAGRPGFPALRAAGRGRASAGPADGPLLSDPDCHLMGRSGTRTLRPRCIGRANVGGRGISYGTAP